MRRRLDVWPESGIPAQPGVHHFIPLTGHIHWAHTPVARSPGVDYEAEEFAYPLW